MYVKLADFIAGRTDFVILYDDKNNPAFVLERDKMQNSNNHLIQEYVLDDKDKKYKALFNKYYRNYYGEYKDPERKRKTTGGKKPYVMVMLNEIKELKKQLKRDGIKNYNEVVGALIDFSEYMEWNTGKLIDTRQRLKKKRLPLKYNDLFEISGYSKGKFENMMKIMKDYRLLWYSDENKENKGYFISQIYFKKGKRGS